MKRIIAAVVLATSMTANAYEVFAQFKNQAGGLTAITTAKCNDGGMIAYTTSANVPTLFGCWWNDDNYIFVRWNDGDTRSYPYSIWTLKKPAKVEPNT